MTWHLLLDEMYAPALAHAITERGHDVLAVASLADLAGSPDDVVLEAATAARRCLVTENVRDFTVLIRHVRHHGVLFVNAQRWPRTPGGIKRLAEALDQAIRAGYIPGQGETRWLA